ncbi:MAG TPA: hypothetical protein VFH87_01685 [Candidatus Udaeobacter sp.]|nr:hypothetical protein [Candidatus Udaeobacter sp.]
MTHKESNQKRLPEGYRLERQVTFTGTTWQVFDIVCDSYAVRGQKTPKSAVDLTLRALEAK